MKNMHKDPQLRLHGTMLVTTRLEGILWTYIEFADDLEH